jgi:hypothetical protein
MSADIDILKKTFDLGLRIAMSKMVESRRQDIVPGMPFTKCLDQNWLGRNEWVEMVHGETAWRHECGKRITYRSERR